MAEPQLAPEWLSSKLPSSSQDRGMFRSYERDNKVRRGYGRTHSYNLLPLNGSSSSSSSSHSHNGNSPSDNSTSWRSAEPNPRVLNRSKSSPVFEDTPLIKDVPKSPDRGSDRNFSPRSLKPKPKGKPPLVASRSQPNLLAPPNIMIQQKLRSSTYSHNSSLSSASPLSSFSSSSPSPPSIVVPSSSSPPNTISSTIVTIQTAPPIIVTSNTMIPSTSVEQEEMNKELEKLRGLVPSVPAINAKGLPRSRGLEPGTVGRKGSQSKVLISKKAPLAVHFRKASSEPLLQQLPFIPRGGDAQNNDTEVKRLDPVFLHKIKSIKGEKMRMKETLEDSDKALVNRNNFFLKVIHQEKTIRDANHETTISSDINNKENITVDEHMDEAEERFLRLLGWVPEEEDHVPCLEEDEIAEARERLAVAQQR